jgi:hypothetical protein
MHRYSFLKETIFNNGGRFGSDFCEISLFKGDIRVGKIIRDHYNQITTIQFGEETYTIQSHWWYGLGLYKFGKRRIARIGSALSTITFLTKPIGRILLEMGDPYSLNYSITLHSEYFTAYIQVETFPDERIWLLHELPYRGEVIESNFNSSPYANEELLLFAIAVLDLKTINLDRENRIRSNAIFGMYRK